MESEAKRDENANYNSSPQIRKIGRSLELFVGENPVPHSANPQVLYFLTAC